MSEIIPSDTPFRKLYLTLIVVVSGLNIELCILTEALVQSFTVILVSEIGDKTFLIAAIMATRHPRLTVFSGAFASLLVMSVLSAAMGKVILGLIPAVSRCRNCSPYCGL
jgi:hypothetical protein